MRTPVKTHLPGDEAPKERWRACAECQTLMRREGLANEEELQSWFIRRVGAHLAKQSPDFDARNFGFPRLSELVEASGIVEVERIGENPKIIMVRLKGGPTPRPAR